MRGLDAWITGNYGEDHPDNQPCHCPDCEAEIDCDEEECPYCGATIE